MTGTRGKGNGYRGRGRGRSSSMDSQTTRIQHANNTQPPPEIEINGPPANIETSERFEGVDQRRGASGQHTSNSSTNIRRRLVDRESSPIDDEMQNEFLSMRPAALADPHSNYSGEGQSSHAEDANSSRVRGASRGTQAPNDDEHRPWIQPDGLGFIPFDVTRQIMNISRQYHGPWPTWGKIPREEKNLLFEKFREHYKWLPEHEAAIRKSWEHGNQNIKNNMYNYRRAAKRKFGDDVEKWKEVVPPCMNSADWVEICDKVFSDPKYKDKCEKAKKNRLKEIDGSISKHNGGSISFREHARRMVLTVCKTKARSIINIPLVGTQSENDQEGIQDPFQEEIMPSPHEIPITCDLDVSHILVDNTANPIEILPSEVTDDSMASRRNIEIEQETEEEEEFEDLISENDKDQQHYDSTGTDDEDFSH